MSSLNAQRRLGEVTSKLTRNFERLATGLRITRAADDAAGLSISESLKADTRVYHQGLRNLNDGISLLAVADGALENLSTIVTRLKELAEQASNGVYGASQRAALDKEAQVLSREYLRIAQTTKFNGLDLLNGSLGQVRLQAGFGTNGGILASVGGTMGTGTFAPYVANTELGVLASGTTGDFNSDGFLDYVASGSTTNVLLGNGDGTFRASTSYATGAAATHIDTADLNGDSILDLISMDGSTGRAHILIGVGNGSFKAPTSYAIGSVSQTLDIGDVNGDGIQDFITGDSGSSTMSVVIGRGDGTFDPRMSFVTSASGGAPISISLGDYNGDSILDAAASNSDGTVSVLFGNGNGTFRRVTSYAAVAGGSPASISSADMNGDGLMDIVTSGTGGAIGILLNRGDGTFQNSMSFATVNNTAGLNLADFNGDGFLDVAAGNFSTTSIYVLLGNGNGSLGAATSFATVHGYTRTGDFNGDGVVDLIGGGALLLGNTRDGVAPILPFDLKTSAGARQALPVLDRKLQQLGVQRGVIGALESRARVAVNTLGIAAESYTEANSRIADADVADEAASLVRLKILQQSAAAVLAQANLQPEVGLNLLRSNGEG